MAVGQARLSSLLFRLVSYLSCYNYIAGTLCLEMKGGDIYLKTGKYVTLLLATHCIRETEAQRLTQAVRKSGREPRCPDVWGYILSTGTYSSIIGEIHEKGMLRKTEEL